VSCGSGSSRPCASKHVQALSDKQIGLPGLHGIAKPSKLASSCVASFVTNILCIMFVRSATTATSPLYVACHGCNRPCMAESSVVALQGTHLVRISESNSARVTLCKLYLYHSQMQYKCAWESLGKTLFQSDIALLTSLIISSKLPELTTLLDLPFYRRIKHTHTIGYIYK
jgi:hypothetical protein